MIPYSSKWFGSHAISNGRGYRQLPVSVSPVAYTPWVGSRQPPDQFCPPAFFLARQIIPIVAELLLTLLTGSQIRQADA